MKNSINRCTHDLFTNPKTTKQQKAIINNMIYL